MCFALSNVLNPYLMKAIAIFILCSWLALFFADNIHYYLQNSNIIIWNHAIPGPPTVPRLLRTASPPSSRISAADTHMHTEGGHDTFIYILWYSTKRRIVTCTALIAHCTWHTGVHLADDGRFGSLVLALVGVGRHVLIRADDHILGFINVR